ncbi:MULTISPECIES: NYN domain-containing protein [unclassified Bosea (in: a-proteobacteria)]|uniref:NYN domain-containing protein n=1 Tax=unclassified Bosea (in: a-proteobacteria) TaxID=2653178 RepID=UPI00125EFEEC|nr:MULTISPECIES: NYN domain-containing protein [unclassified Bosea (in: a-proteobacteria)]
MRTIVYVDGFNLYYRLLKDQPQFKWLNLCELAKQVLSPKNQIIKVRYFTARVSGRFDPTTPARQQAYLSALSTIPEIESHFGNFLVSKTWAGIVHPDLDPAKPNAKPPFLPWPNVVRVHKTEEKGSDVNLASHLLSDAYNDRFDVAAIITNDTDLVEPIRLVRSEVGKTIGLLTPVPKPSASLAREAHFCHHITNNHLSNSQFPDFLNLPGGKVVNRPPEWAAAP